ncbi:fimbria/pilus outer membrane usher protein [Brevundimonas sp.]|uniref:fimbria/pilus outer membrane usher protein n=1 Tax=Brevundimonas sp. TaxID=1871086 RepID=UPI0035AD8050
MSVSLAALIAAAALNGGAQEFAATPAVQTVPAVPVAGVAAAQDQRFRLSISLSLNGAYVGDVPVEASLAGDASVEVARLVELLRPLVAPEVIDGLVARSAGAGMASTSVLSGPDLTLTFDQAALALSAQITADARALNRLSLIDATRQGGGARLTPPSNRAFGITVALNTQIEHEGFLNDLVREPAEVAIRGFGNVGGVDGLNLAFETGYREDGDFARRRTTLFYDDVPRAIRYALGDVDPETLGAYQAPISLAGLSIERLYQEIQPYRNVRPSGRGQLTLESASRVEVLVNGVVQQTLRLGPGRYDLRDFPFLDGYNDVQLVVEDDTGRREVSSISFFSDIELLEPGVSIFSASLGVQQESGGFFEDPEYGDDLVFSGFYQRGVTDALTLGAASQINPENALFAGQAAYATRFGVFGIQAALDINEDDDTEQALLLTWRLFGLSESGRQSGVQVDFEAVSEGFSPMLPTATTFNANEWEVDARYQTELPLGVFATLGAGYSRSRGPFDDQKRATLALSRSFGRFSLGLNLEHRDGGFSDESRIGLSISVPLGERMSARARYNSSRDEAVVELDRRAYDSLDEFGYRVALGTSEGGPLANADLEYFGNRFRARVTHDYSDADGFETQVTNAGVTFGIGWADGRLALGREADRGFVIVDPHPTLGGAPVFARSRSTFGDTARSGALGPALAPLQRPYAYDSIEVRVEDAPDGYDIGAGRIDVVPGAASGYVLPIGSAASNTVMGRLVQADGEPAALVGGVLKPVSGQEAVETSFFTNRTGRLVAQQVAPGRYQVFVFGSDTPVGEIEVPEDSAGMVDIGTLTYGGDTQ